MVWYIQESWERPMQCFPKSNLRTNYGPLEILIILKDQTVIDLIQILSTTNWTLKNIVFQTILSLFLSNFRIGSDPCFVKWVS